MSENKLQLIDDLVLGKDICVLGTSDGRNPHVSLMAFLVDHATMKFYFLSRKNSHKSQNIKKCPHVSILIDTREEHLPDNRDKAMALTIQGVYAPINKPQTIKGSPSISSPNTLIWRNSRPIPTRSSFESRPKPVNSYADWKMNFQQKFKKFIKKVLDGKSAST